MAPYSIEELRNIVSPIARAHGVASVSLFGSYAKGLADAGSDVDLKIDKGALRSLFQLCGFRLAIEDALKLPVDLVTSDSSDRSRKTRWCSIETRDRLILQKIVLYCQRVADNLERYHHDFSAFEQDYLFQDACCMCVVQIGELVSQLSDETKAQNKAIPWRIIKDTRNFYVHAYGAIDIPSVWDTLINDIPALKIACEAILTQF